jgi:uncharacterized protein (TIGR02453 family)
VARFEGFADAKASFFKRLAKNNDRIWFAKHKDEFEAGWNAPMKALLADVKDAIDATYAHCDLGEPKVFRIYRDVRFAKDKSPYKTNLGGLIPMERQGTRVTDLPIACYFHIGAEETLAAAGHYMMEPPSLARFRKAVAEDARGKELAKIIASLGKKGFKAEAYESLKKVPKGFDPDHPRAELLRGKGLTVRYPAPPAAMVATPKLAKWLADASKTAAPLVEWLVFATA